jgi:hypothetical protein
LDEITHFRVCVKLNVYSDSSARNEIFALWGLTGNDRYHSYASRGAQCESLSTTHPITQKSYMIRTAISFLALFGSLLFVSKALTQTRPQEKLPAARPQVTPVEGWRSRAAPAPAAPVTALPGRASAGLREAAATGTHSGFRRLLSAAVRTGSTLEQLLRNPITGQIENLWQNVTSFDSRPEAGTDWKPEAGTDWKAGSSITAQTPA